MTCQSPARSVCHRCVHQLKCFISSHLRLSSWESLCLQSVSQSFTCFLFSHFNKFLQKRRWRSDEGLIVDYLQFVCLFVYLLFACVFFAGLTALWSPNKTLLYAALQTSSILIPSVCLRNQFLQKYKKQHNNTNLMRNSSGGAAPPAHYQTQITNEDTNRTTAG